MLDAVNFDNTAFCDLIERHSMNKRSLYTISLFTLGILAACANAATSPEASAKTAKADAQATAKQVATTAPASPILLAAAEEPAKEQAVGADGFKVPEQKKAMGEAPPPPADVMTPLERVKATPIGKLKNPYANNPDMAKWGQKRYMSNSCNGCHGGTGGGGMCPPLSNETWVYGSDDDTLFRLIALGSDELQKQLGISRKGRENVVGPMPAFGGIIKTDDELWRIITFVRTTYRGDPARKNW